MKVTEQYLQLLQDFPPRPIASEEEFELTQERIDRLLDKPELSRAEADYLDVLGTLVYEYESQQEDLIPDIYGIELLKALITEYGLKQKDLLPIFKTESIVSEILKGKRQLTVRHIQELAEFFKLSPVVFFPVKASSQLVSI